MKLCHAATLALLGWYLMRPPPLAMNPNSPDLSAPLSNWEASQEMTTLSMCENERKIEIALEHNPYSLYQQYIDAEKAKPPKGYVFSIAKMQEFADAEKCVASDDPRLKGDHEPDLGDTGSQDSSPPSFPSFSN
jgi:hypothetical protein